MCNAGVVRENERVETLVETNGHWLAVVQGGDGHEYRWWNEVDGEFVMLVMERSGDGIYGPGCMQSVEVTKPPSMTRLFCVSSDIPPVISDANKRGISARDQGIEFMARSHGKY